MKIKAYAKINLTLDIVGILPKGYHALSSVMAPISLWDEITMEKSEGFAFNCNIASIATEDNLCVRAANAFFAETGIKQWVSIYLEKHIPFPAGLGGGSADCAAVLRGLNTLYENPLSEEALFQIASSLGSDISVCLLGRPALCEGRGEILTPIKPIPKFNLVVAIGKARLSTPQVYKAYDNANLPVSTDTQSFLSALDSGSEAALISACGNAFTPVAEALCPEIKEIKEALLYLGAQTACLSGSGPSVYGIFKSAENADAARERLIAMGYSAYSCTIL